GQVCADGTLPLQHARCPSRRDESMKHTIDDLLTIARGYYPHRVPSHEASYAGTAEHLRLSAARRRAGASDEVWRAMLRRFSGQFPGIGVQNRSAHLTSGTWDACYSGAIHFPDHRWLGFLVSFIAPYYIVYSARIVDDPEATEARGALERPHGAEEDWP